MTPHRMDRWRSTKSRRSQKRRQRPRILIICEGQETERNYFDQMKRDGWARENLTVSVKRGKGGSREQIAQFAVDCKNNANEPFDKVWCVMDVEGLADRASCEKALRNLKGNGIEPCLSNPAFEVWLLSHFQKTTSSYLHCNAVVSVLAPQWKSRFNRDYDKADRSLYKLLSPLTATAMTNARWTREEYHSLQHPILECNSATEVYRLVEKFLGPNPTVARGKQGPHRGSA